MASVASVQNDLEELSLPQNIVQQLQGLLSASLGPSVLQQMRDVLGQAEFFQNTFYQERYMLGWGMCVDVLAAVEGSRYAAAAEILSKAESDPNMEFGKIFLPFLIDLTELLRNKGEDSRVLQDVVRRLRVAHMRYLSISALLQLVQYDVVYFLRFHEQFLSDIRYLYYVAEPEYDGGEWGRQFVPVLKKNQELLGSQIMVLGKPVAATVEHWLAEYDVASGKQALERGALDRIKFTNEHPSAKQLSKEDQGVLLKLCELYDWFADPYVTEAELGEFVDLAPAATRAGLVPSAESNVSDNGEAQDSDAVEVRDQYTAADRVQPLEELGGVPEHEGGMSTMAPAELPQPEGAPESDEQTMEGADTVPNVQGVLVQVPLGASERTGLEMVEESGVRTQTAETEPQRPSGEGDVGVPGVEGTKQESAAALKNAPSVSNGPDSALPAAAGMPLETLKADAQKKQAQIQEEIEHKLEDLKRKV